MHFKHVNQGEDSPDRGSWEELTFIPEDFMAKVIGKNRMNLDKIEAKTKATLKVSEKNSLYIKGSPESKKQAIREIKETMVSRSVTYRVLCGIFQVDITKGQNTNIQRLPEYYQVASNGANQSMSSQLIWFCLSVLASKLSLRYNFHNWPLLMKTNYPIPNASTTRSPAESLFPLGAW